MKILDITFTVRDLPASVEFYRGILGMAIHETTDRAVVHAGSSRMTLIPGERFDGVHHVAFGIVPSEFELAHAWLSERVVLLLDDGSEVIIGSPEWDSRSLYFLGPEDIVLEFIARGADADQTPGDGESPRILSISEIGICVPDVSATVRRLSHELALPPFFSQGESFAPVGDHDGLLIVVQQDRIWFPTQSLRAARGPLEVRLEAPTAKTPVNLTPAVSIATARSVS